MRLVEKLISLCKEHTNLSETDIEQLLKVYHSMPIFAELTQSYYFIDCLTKQGLHAIVVAEAFPKLDKPLYNKSVLGKIVFETFEPGVFYSLRKGKRSIIKHAITQEGKRVQQTVTPIKNDNGNIIAVLIEEKSITHFGDIYLDDSNLSIPTKIIDTILSTKFNFENRTSPILSDILIEMFILTNNDRHLIYANPVAIKFIVEMSNTDQIYNQDITTFLPFLIEMYEEKDDVYVFERTVGSKSLIIKKMRLKQKDNSYNTLFIIQDLTELKKKEQELSIKSTMIKEIHHRVKNNLQTIASLLRLQMNQDLPKESITIFEETISRIYSISAVYELLLSKANSDSELVDIIELTETICSKLVINTSYKKINLVIKKNCNEVLINQPKAVSIALIINELVQNALKHAFKNRENGEIVINFTIQHGQKMAIHVSDNGVGMSECKPSLGLDIVSTLVENDLNGKFTFEPVRQGTCAFISFHLDTEVDMYNESKTNINS